MLVLRARNVKHTTIFKKLYYINNIKLNKSYIQIKSALIVDLGNQIERLFGFTMFGGICLQDFVPG